jgi:hypothetical protein
MRPAAVQGLTGSAYKARGLLLFMRVKFDEELLRHAGTSFSPEGQCESKQAGAVA